MLKFGQATKKITPEGKVRLAGDRQHVYTDEIEAKTNLWATALCIQSVDSTICILSMDTISGSHLIKTTLEQQFSDTISSIEVVGTHTHSAPSPRDIDQAILAACVQEAYNNLQEGTISFGHEKVLTGVPRRQKFFANDEITYNNIGASSKSIQLFGGEGSERFKGFDGDTDCLLHSVFIHDTQGNLTGIIINVPCPAQTMVSCGKMSSDYWGLVRHHLKKFYNNDNLFILPICGAEGDLSAIKLSAKFMEDNRLRAKAEKQKQPVDVSKVSDKKTSYGKVDISAKTAYKIDLAQTVYKSVQRTYVWAQKEKTELSEFELVNKELTLKSNVFDEQDVAELTSHIQWLQTKLEQPELTQNEITKFKFQLDYDSYILETREIGSQKDLKCSYSILQLGEIAFVFLGFEIFTDVAHRIQAQSPFTSTVICALSGEYGNGYLAGERSTDLGGYGAGYENKFAPGESQKLVNEITASLRDMYLNDIDREQVVVENIDSFGTSYLDNFELRTLKDTTGSICTMQDSGAYKLEGSCGEDINYIISDPDEDLANPAYLEPGEYAVYGLTKLELLNTQTNEYSYQLGVENEQTRFTLNEPMLLTQVSIPVAANVAYNTQTVPIVLKTVDTSAVLPVIRITDNAIYAE